VKGNPTRYGGSPSAGGSLAQGREPLVSGALPVQRKTRAAAGLNLRRWLRPYTLTVLGAAVSFLVWVFPWGGDIRTGFTIKQPITLVGITVLVLWYGTIFLSSKLGYSLGSTRAPYQWIQSVNDTYFYATFTVLALLGVGYTYFLVVQTSPTLVSIALSQDTFNSVRSAIPYSAGLETLRYASIVSGAIAAYEILLRRKISPVHLINLGLLLASAAIASRLSIVLAGLLFMGIVAQKHSGFRVRPVVVIGALAIGFLVLTPLNYIRNANFYRVQYGLTNPFVMTAYDMIAYLGAPSQVSIGVANNVGSQEPERDVGAGIVAYVLPTYLSAYNSTVAQAQENYRNYVDVETLLTTNSVFASMYGALGWSALPIIAVIAFVFSVVAGHASNYRNTFFLMGYVISYAFAELWRVYLFNFGILHFLIAVLVIIPIVVAVVRPSKESM